MPQSLIEIQEEWKSLEQDFQMLQVRNILSADSILFNSAKSIAFSF